MAGLEDFYSRGNAMGASSFGAEDGAAGWRGGVQREGLQGASPWASSTGAPPAPPQYVDTPRPHLQYPARNPPPAFSGGAGAADAGGSASSERYAGLSFGVAGLVADYLVSHPFTVLRRQCQVNNASFRHHRTPFTLLPVAVNLNRSQGLGCLWKGLGSSLTVRGLTLAVEDFTSKFTPWPKEIDRQSSLRMVGQHLLLKAVSLAVVSPFYSASLVETVQSEIASERPGIFDVFRDGLSRVLNWSCPHSGRMLPVWLLVPPTVAHGVAHYSVYVVASSLSHSALVRTQRHRERSKGALCKDGSQPGLAQYQEQLAGLLGHLVADVLLYPLETILHRLHMQGCRTIVDNLDTGREVMPIMTRYEGFFDCASTVLEEEGVAGLFKGFGALVLQYAVQYAVIRFSATLISEVARIASQDTMPPPPELAKYTQQQQARGGGAGGYQPMARAVSSDDFREPGPQQQRGEPPAAVGGDPTAGVRSSQSTPTVMASSRRKIFPNADYGNE